MRSGMIEVGWSLEIGVEGGWSSSTLLAIPVMLLPVGSLPPVELRPQPPSVGRARRRQLWGPAATRAGLTYDPDAEAWTGATFRVANGGQHIEVLQHRSDAGSVAP